MSPHNKIYASSHVLSIAHYYHHFRALSVREHYNSAVPSSGNQPTESDRRPQISSIGTITNTVVPDQQHITGTAQSEGQAPIAVAPARRAITASEYHALDATAAQSRSTATKRAYTADWHRFAAWARSRGFTELPAAPDLIGVYLNETAQTRDSSGHYSYAVSTLTRWLSAINQAHIAAGYRRPGDDQRLTHVMAGIKRSRGSQQRRMAPLLTDDIRHIAETLDYSSWPDSVAAYRDSAIMLLGFAGAFRRSELANLTVGDVAFDRADGLHVRVRRSKIDQEGHGLVKAIPYGRSPAMCGPCAFQRWVSLLSAAEAGSRVRLIAWIDADDRSQHLCRGHNPGYRNDERPLFRPVTKSGAIGATRLSDHSINQIVKNRAARIGFDPNLFGGHSLRSGFVTEAFRRGQDSRTIRKQTGHKNDAMLDIYDRDNAPMHNNAAAHLGL